MPTNISDNDVREFRRLRKKVDGMRGPGVVNKPGSITINPPPIPPNRSANQLPSSNGFWGRIADSDGTGAHGWVEIEWTGATSSTDKSGGRFGTLAGGFDADDLGPIFEANKRKKVPNDKRVWIYPLPLSSGTSGPKYGFDLADGDSSLSPLDLTTSQGIAGAKPDTTTFDVENQGTGLHGVAFTFLSRDFVVDKTGGVVVHNLFSRTANADDTGRILKFSAETLVQAITIDPSGVCSGCDNAAHYTACAGVDTGSHPADLYFPLFMEPLANSIQQFGLCYQRVGRTFSSTFVYDTSADPVLFASCADCLGTNSCYPCPYTFTINISGSVGGGGVGSFDGVYTLTCQTGTGTWKYIDPTSGNAWFTLTSGGLQVTILGVCQGQYDVGTSGACPVLGTYSGHSIGAAPCSNYGTLVLSTP